MGGRIFSHHYTIEQAYLKAVINSIACIGEEVDILSVFLRLFIEGVGSALGLLGPPAVGSVLR